MAAAVTIALLMNISFQRAKDIVNQVRNVSFSKHEREMNGPWINDIIREGVANEEVPTGFSCGAASQGNVVVHATTMANDEAQPICR